MDPIKGSPPRTRHQFDQTFKREAVRNGLASGKSAIRRRRRRRLPSAKGYPRALSDADRRNSRRARLRKNGPPLPITRSGRPA